MSIYVGIGGWGSLRRALPDKTIQRIILRSERAELGRGAGQAT
jgi:hypothetical protein